MAKTKITEQQIFSVSRSNLVTTISGKSVISRIIEEPNTGVKIFSSTGADSGTGDVRLKVDTVYLDGIYLKAETDPVFTASASFGITGTNITNWNTGYNKRPTAIGISGTTTKTITLTLGDATTLTANWSDITATSLSVLTDVNVSSITNRQLLAYDTATSKWINWSPNYLGILGTGTDATNTSASGLDIRAPYMTIGDQLSAGAFVGNYIGLKFQDTGNSHASLVFDSVNNTLHIANSSTTNALIPAGFSGGVFQFNLATGVITANSGTVITSSSVLTGYTVGTNQVLTASHTWFNALRDLQAQISAISGGSGISNLNTLTATTQTFAVGTSGTDFNIASSVSTHTFNIPDASAANRGLVTTGTQTLAGTKIFSGFATNSGANTNYSFVWSGSSNETQANLLMAGSTSISAPLIFGGLSRGINDNYSHATLILAGTTVTEGATGTHPLIANLAIKAFNITNGSATTTNGATLYIEGAATGTGVPTNNYALWVDNGTSRFDGNIEIPSNAFVVGSSVSPALFVTALSMNNLGSNTLTNFIGSPTSFKIGSYGNVGTIGVANNNGTNYLIGSTTLSMSGGTSPLIANLAIKPILISGTGTATNSATVYIEGAGTGATNNYALWVGGGTTRFDGDVRITTGNGNLTLSGDISGTNNFFGASGSSGSGASPLTNYPTVSYKNLFAYQSVQFTLSNSPTNAQIQNHFGGATFTAPTTGSFGLTATATFRGNTITAGVGTVTNNATVYIEDAGTGATNNYALWVDNGTSRFDGTITANGQLISNNYLNASSGSVNLSHFASDRNIALTSVSTFTLGGIVNIHAYGRWNGDWSAHTLVTAINHSHWIFGDGPINGPTSGTTAISANVAIKGNTITPGAGTVSNSAALYIDGAGTGATNNYALWVAGGTSRFDGALTIASDSTINGLSIGRGPSGDTGSVVLGYNALLAASNANGYNVAIGFNAMKVLTTATNGIAIGYGSQFSNLTSSHNTSVGWMTLNAFNSAGAGNNSVYGVQSGRYLTSGIQNTLIGALTGSAATFTTVSGMVALGYQAGMNETTNNKLYIANSSTATPLIYGDFSTPALTINGSLTVPGLGGAGAQMVVVDNNGLFSKQAIPSGTGGGGIDNQSAITQTASFDISGTGAIRGGTTLGGNTSLLSTNGAYLGFTGFTTGMTVDFRFGDVNNRLVNTFGSTLNLESYHGSIISNNSVGSNTALRVWQKNTGATRNIFELGRSGTYSPQLTMFNNGNLLLQPAGTHTDNGFKFEVVGTVKISGATTISSLGGLGAQMVVVDNNGLLATQAIPTGGSSAVRIVETFTATAGQTVFTTTNAFSSTQIDVFINGSRLTSSSYSTSGSYTVTLVDAAVVSDIVEVVIYTGSISSVAPYTISSISTNTTEATTSGTRIVQCTTTSASINLTLPSAVGNVATIVVKKMVDANNVNILTTASQTIDGGSSAVLVEGGESITLVSNNVNWLII